MSIYDKTYSCSCGITIYTITTCFVSSIHQRFLSLIFKSQNIYPPSKGSFYPNQKIDKCLGLFLLPQEAESLPIPVFL